MELAEASSLSLVIREEDVPVIDPVVAACEILGLDPLYVASEGRFLAVIPPKDAQRALDILKSFEVSRGAKVIGEVTDHYGPKAIMRTVIGTDRVLEMLSGEQLPRIC